MKKLISVIVYTVLYLFLTIPVSANFESGHSAKLALTGSKYNTDTTKIDAIKKKIAIRNVLESYGSPMASEAENFYDACVKYDIDCYLLPSIAGLESWFGSRILPGSYNPFGWGRGLIRFKDWNESIDTVGAGLRKNYIDKGAETVEEIGAIYCEGNTWAGKVRFFMEKFKAEEEKITLFSADFPVKL